MASIISSQYADKDQSLVFVLYDDDTHEILPSHQLSGDQAIDEFVPLIEGGVIPLGAIMWFCNQRVPAGYLLCDGSAISRNKYQQLFRAIGTIYGSGDGQTTFNLPNLVGRFCRGWGPDSPLDPGRLFGTYQNSSFKTHAHEYPAISHVHELNDPGHSHEIVDPGHSHATIDPGHTHPVTDPGHFHVSRVLAHGGMFYAYNILVNGIIELTIDGLFYGYFFYNIDQNTANMNVLRNVSNSVMAISQIGITNLPQFTNISVDTAVTNLTKTELSGANETRPKNIALLPVIRY